MARDGKQTDIEPRGTNGRLERLPTADLEANDEFLTTFRAWANGPLTQAANARAREIMTARGIDPEAEMPLARAFEPFADDAVIQARHHVWLHAQNLMWRNLRRELHDNYDGYMAEMEAADASGPGTLELNPNLAIPDYATHEIHLQPGGYVGDPFAGHLYHYGTNNFYTGRNNQDELHRRYASSVPAPADKTVRRILDQGCGCGQMSVALKERFPNAEVWGIDVSGPMVRYAHMRAVDLGVDVRFAQRLAEDCKFPDGHFDIVTSYILHHEVTAEASRGITREAHRVLRAGGIYYPIDINTAGTRGMVAGAGPFNQVRNWMSHRWTHERWLFEYNSFDHATETRRVGFEVTEDGSSSGMGGVRGNILGVKRA
ncbi:MAG: class I SAM-dependent methyltransferase [Alphaproteobacteria bacterium]|nr:class I SAM-dependent methyltransferase [Alphaproteobacteria bacterium]